MGDLVKKTPFGEIEATIEALDRAGITPELAHRLRTDRDCLLRVTGAWKGLSVNESFPDAESDWRTIINAINAGGFTVNPHLVLDFGKPFAYKRQRVFAYDFNRRVSFDEVVSTMDNNGHIPASFEVLLVFAYRRKMDKAIVALGSKVQRKGGAENRYPYMRHQDLSGLSVNEMELWEGTIYLAVEKE